MFNSKVIATFFVKYKNETITQTFPLFMNEQQDMLSTT